MRPGQILQQALTGGAIERPLIAPLATAVAGELAGLSPRAFLANATKLANSLNDLQRALSLDVVVAESGAALELEVLGAVLDWERWPPRPQAPLRPGPVPADLSTRGRLPVLLDAIGRLHTMLADRALVGVALYGPWRLARLAGAACPPAPAAALTLSLARLCCEAGARLIWLLEDGRDPPPDAGAYAAALAPVVGTIRFYQSVPALHLPGAAGGWQEVLKAMGGAVVPCYDPAAAPQLAAVVSPGTAYGIIVPAATATDNPRSTAGPGCLLLTSDREWAGQVAARELAQAVAALKLYF